jgi:hypothetical protein
MFQRGVPQQFARVVAGVALMVGCGKAADPRATIADQEPPSANQGVDSNAAPAPTKQWLGASEAGLGGGSETLL